MSHNSSLDLISTPASSLKLLVHMSSLASNKKKMLSTSFKDFTLPAVSFRLALNIEKGGRAWVHSFVRIILLPVLSIL